MVQITSNITIFLVQNSFGVIYLEQNTAWNKFAASGKIADYLEYRQACNNTVGDFSRDADKNRRNRDKATENQ